MFTLQQFNHRLLVAFSDHIFIELIKFPFFYSIKPANQITKPSNLECEGPFVDPNIFLLDNTLDSFWEMVKNN